MQNKIFIEHSISDRLRDQAKDESGAYRTNYPDRYDTADYKITNGGRVFKEDSVLRTEDVGVDESLDSSKTTETVLGSNPFVSGFNLTGVQETKWVEQSFSAEISILDTVYVLKIENGILVGYDISY